MYLIFHLHFLLTASEKRPCIWPMHVEEDASLYIHSTAPLTPLACMYVLIQIVRG